MAILENIRKRTTVLILIIGMALFAFVISGIFTSNGLSGGKVGSSVGEINGEEISIDVFRQQLERATRTSGQNVSSMQLVNSIWTQLERNTLLDQQISALGIDIEQDQIIEIIKNSPGLAQNPQFVDENGNFDERRFREFILELKVNAPTQYQDWLQDEQAIIENAKQQAYFNLVRAGMGATLKEGELDYKLANNKVDIRYVRVPYTSIPDSTITVTKKEIEAYIKENEKKYTQERSRDIQFVYFEEGPSEKDVEETKSAITALLDDAVEYSADKDKTDTIAGFRNTKDVEAFLSRHSDAKYDSIFKAKAELPANFADSLMALGDGELFGPYRDGDVFKVSRMMAKKPNGSVKASHILITYAGAERANPSVTRTKERAKTKADEVLKKALEPNAGFAQLARDNSDGPSAPRGGDLGYFQEGVMTPKFNDFAFGNPVGYIGLVETEFGFHIVKVDEKRDLVQLATLTRDIEPSDETVNSLFTDATKFEMAAVDSDKSLSEVAQENDYVVRPVNRLKAMDENLPGLGAQRRIVQWAFSDDTKLGDIRRFDVNDGYAVVQLTATYKEGLMDVEDASVTVLPLLRKKKKAERIKTANTGKSMSEIASANNTTVSTATALTVKSPTIPGAGREPLVVGTAFSMETGQTSKLIEGESGVFMFEVTKREDAPELDNYSTYANSLQSGLAARVANALVNALKEKAEIEDNRSVFY
ncbi:peptidyl-prolyl cis-trans isomerase D [Muriicola jejuensis]|uniref:Periplasmic chaperone PpiD n=1 Tax=Muriicola jejuensis TaxID=504488 RepID=A0A6P0UGQ7_9FLAO|nr:peptidylprolyl isomerase [Muriicola jejuensis]NER11640.1 peptidylprolyl isomerase [Muriicola jejuensis]SMP25753.1 peptidyl-prolyl cis-trans isomerase D [Muriicola jejuensis]